MSSRNKLGQLYIVIVATMGTKGTTFINDKDTTVISDISDYFNNNDNEYIIYEINAKSNNNEFNSDYIMVSAAHAGVQGCQSNSPIQSIAY